MDPRTLSTPQSRRIYGLISMVHCYLGVGDMGHPPPCPSANILATQSRGDVASLLYFNCAFTLLDLNMMVFNRYEGTAACRRHSLALYSRRSSLICAGARKLPTRLHLAIPNNIAAVTLQGLACGAARCDN